MGDTEEEKGEIHAVEFLIEMAKLYPGEITILCLAPLTNIAHAVQKDPEFSSRIKNLVILGGSYLSQGNAFNCTAEFNFFNDPLSAQTVIHSFSDILIVPIELCYDFMNMSMEALEPAFNHKSEKGQFVYDIF